MHLDHAFEACSKRNKSRDRRLVSLMGSAEGMKELSFIIRYSNYKY